MNTLCSLDDSQDDKIDFAKKTAPLCILLAGIMWGTMGLFVRKLNALGLATMNIVALRIFCTSIILSIFCLVFDRSVFYVRFKDLWCFFGTGIASIIFFNFCYFKTITLTSLSVAAVLLYTAPSIVMLLSLFLFKEKITFRKILAAAFAFVGCVLVSLDGGGDNKVSVTAIFTGLGAGFGYALYTIFGRYALCKGYSSLAVTLWTFFFACFGILPFADLPLIFSVSIQSSNIILFVVLFAMIATVLPYILYTFGLVHVDGGKASVISSVEPAAAAILGILVFSEPVTIPGVAGILLVLFSIFLLS